MISCRSLLCLAATALLVTTSLPASAQVVDDFLCSTFSYKCNQQKPLPPPQLAPGVEPDAPKHVPAKKHKAKAKRTPAPAAAAPAPAADAAPK